MKFNLETIRKIWVLVSTLVLTISLPNMPELVTNLFSEVGTNMFFGLIELGVDAYAALGLFLQFLKKRTGEDQPQALQIKSTGAKISYVLFPWKAAA
jgi:hypothetical protein